MWLHKQFPFTFILKYQDDPHAVYFKDFSSWHPGVHCMSYYNQPIIFCAVLSGT